MIHGVGMFSIFEARLQEIFKDANYAFDQAEKVLKEKDEFALYEKFHDLRQAINVLKHGDGKSTLPFFNQITINDRAKIGTKNYWHAI